MKTIILHYVSSIWVTRLYKKGKDCALSQIYATYERCLEQYLLLKLNCRMLLFILYMSIYIPIFYILLMYICFSADEAQKKSSGQEHPFTPAGVCSSRYGKHSNLWFSSRYQILFAFFHWMLHYCKILQTGIHFLHLSLDLMVEFIVTHMMKDFPMDLYLWGHTHITHILLQNLTHKTTPSQQCVYFLCRRCVQIIHKLLCYQKKCRIRLHYTWRELWSGKDALLSLSTSFTEQGTHASIG